MSDSISAVIRKSFISPSRHPGLNAFAQLLSQSEQGATDGVGSHLHAARNFDRRYTKFVMQLDEAPALFGKLLQALLQCRLFLRPRPLDLAALREPTDMFCQAAHLRRHGAGFLAPEAQRDIPCHGCQQRFDIPVEIPLIRLADKLKKNLLSNVLSQTRGRCQSQSSRANKVPMALCDFGNA